MKANTLITALGLASPINALLRFGCSQSSIQRLDPLVNPGMIPSTHLHQIIGGVCLPNSLELHREDSRKLTHLTRTPSTLPWTRQLTT